MSTEVVQNLRAWGEVAHAQGHDARANDVERAADEIELLRAGLERIACRDRDRPLWWMDEARDVLDGKGGEYPACSRYCGGASVFQLTP